MKVNEAFLTRDQKAARIRQGEFTGTEDGGTVVARVLKNAGVDTVMTMAGGHVSSIFQGLKADGIRSILFRDERATSFAAAAWGAATRSPGVCLVTAGPGLTNAVTGLAQAQRSGWPVVSIAGSFEQFSLDMGGLQEMDQAGMMASISKWSRAVPDAARIGEYIERAIQAAMTPPFGHAHVSIPVDLLSRAVTEFPPLRDAAKYAAASLGGPSDEVVRRIVGLIKKADRPIVVAGPGVWFDHGEEALFRFVDRTGIPTFTEDEARGIVPDAHDAGVGPILYGLSGARDLIKEADLVLVVGTKPDWRTEFLRPPLLPSSFSAVFIQIDSNPEHLTGYFAKEVAFLGSEAATLSRLAEAIPAERCWESWRTQLKNAQTAHVDAVLAKERTLREGNTIHPATITEVVRDAAVRDDVNVVFDGGAIGKWGKLLIPATKPGQWSRYKGPFAAIGHGLPSAIVKSLADPSRPSLLTTGDGSFGYHAVEIETAVQYGANVTAVVVTDGAWGSVQEGQYKRFQDVEGTLIPRTRFDLVAQALGAEGHWVEDAAMLRDVLAQPHRGVRVIAVNSETVFPPVHYPPGRYSR